jgi:hypothetical protein
LTTHQFPEIGTKKKPPRCPPNNINTSCLSVQIIIK